jgi:hypothetical protein
MGTDRNFPSLPVSLFFGGGCCQILDKSLPLVTCWCQRNKTHKAGPIQEAQSRRDHLVPTDQ